MKHPRHLMPALLSAILIPGSAQVFAQAATLNDCQAIADRLARYACYDNWDAVSGTVRQSAPRASTPRQESNDDETSLFGRVFDRDSEASPEAQPQVATDGGSESTASGFGRNPSNARVIEGDEGTELIDSIADLEQLGPSLWLITLDGGQQWKQMLSKRYNLEAGDEVRIYPTRWGSSYRLTSERLGGYIQVQRVDSMPTLSSRAPAPRPERPQPVAQEEAEGRSLLGRIFNRGSDEEPAGDPPAAASQNGEASVEGFGRPQTGARVMEGADGKSELIDTVAAVEQLGPSLLLITLEGGQTWQQMISKRYNLNVGDEVRIYPTRWGSSYRLSSARAGSYIQVERVD